MGRLKRVQQTILTLSSSWTGLSFILFLFFLLITSVFGFTGSLIESLYLRNQLSLYHGKFDNNLLHKSFEQRLTAPIPIDVVYTWVNGSDPLLLDALSLLREAMLRDLDVNESSVNLTDIKSHNSTKKALSRSRFEDNDELKYSLRSLEKYAPWVRHIYIVTNGQIPSWIDIKNPKLSIVTHEDIFVNQSHLPSFSSPSIETHLHRIPGLSKKFLYMNDDVMFAQEVWPEDFYTHSDGQKIYVSWTAPGCAEGCPNNWLGDTFCDLPCNVTECEFDFGDCANHSNSISSSSVWSKSDIVSCSPGCPVSWVGDRYCDNLCKNEACGMDATDCGEKLLKESVAGLIVDSDGSHEFTVPYNSSSVFINITSQPDNFKFVNVSHDNPTLVSHAIASQGLKLITLLFHENVTQQSVSLNVQGVIGNSSEWSSTIALAYLGSSKHEEIRKAEKVENTLNDKSLVVIKIQERKNLNTNSWAPATNPNDNLNSFSEDEYKLCDGYSLPEDILNEILRLKIDYENAEYTYKGYRKRLRIIYKPYTTNCTLVDPNTNSSNSTVNETVPNRNIRDSLILEKNRVNSRSLLSLEGFDSSDYVGNLLPWEEAQLFDSLVKQKTVRDSFDTALSHTSRSLQDKFSDSLRHVDLMYTRRFGPFSRKIIAHMPHMIDKDIMYELQNTFPTEFDRTSSNKVRGSDDMQYAFSYFWYLAGAKKEFSMLDIWNNIDTDENGFISDREVRLLAAQAFKLPIEAKEMDSLYQQLVSCAQNETLGTTNNDFNRIASLSNSSIGKDDNFGLFHGEGSVSQETFLNCLPVKNLLWNATKTLPKFNYEIREEKDYVAFQMIRNNVSSVTDQLDEIRKARNKFVCINDDVDHSLPSSTRVQRAILELYLSLFPHPSQFELKGGSKNVFLYIKDYKEWETKEHEAQKWVILYTIMFVLLALFLIYRKIRKIWRKNQLLPLASSSDFIET